MSCRGTISRLSHPPSYQTPIRVLTRPYKRRPPFLFVHRSIWFPFPQTGHADQAHKAVATALPGVPAEHGPADSVHGQDAVVTAADPRRNEEMPQGLRYGASRPVVHTVQVEKGLQPFWRLGQEAAPFVRPRAEIIAEPTPEFANATLKHVANCQQTIANFRVSRSVSQSVVTAKLQSLGRYIVHHLPEPFDYDSQADFAKRHCIRDTVSSIETLLTLFLFLVLRLRGSSVQHHSSFSNRGKRGDKEHETNCKRNVNPMTDGGRLEGLIVFFRAWQENSKIRRRRSPVDTYVHGYSCSVAA